MLCGKAARNSKQQGRWEGKSNHLREKKEKLSACPQKKMLRKKRNFGRGRISTKRSCQARPFKEQQLTKLKKGKVEIFTARR